MKPLQILIVDDEPEVIDIYKKYAKAILDSKGNITTAQNGNQALEIVAELQQLDFLITDVEMPKMTGEKLYWKLKEKFPNLKVLFASGTPLKNLLSNGVVSSINADDFLLKSSEFEFTELTGKIKKLLDIN